MNSFNVIQEELARELGYQSSEAYFKEIDGNVYMAERLRNFISEVIKRQENNKQVNHDEDIPHKYIPMKVANGFPKKEGTYPVFFKDNTFEIAQMIYKKEESNEKYWSKHIDTWLDKVPDYTIPLKTMLGEVLTGRVSPSIYSLDWDRIAQLLKDVDNVV